MILKSLIKNRKQLTKKYFQMDFQRDYVDYFFHENRWRFLILYQDGMWKNCLDCMELAREIEITPIHQEEERHLISFLNHNFGKKKPELKNRICFTAFKSNPAIDSETLNENDISCSLITEGYFNEEAFIEVVYQDHIWRYSGTIDEKGFIAKADQGQLFQLIPSEKQKTEELNELVITVDTGFRQLHRNGNGSCFIKTADALKKNMGGTEIVKSGRSSINLLCNGGVYQFSCEFDGDNVIFANTIRKIWPLGSEACTEEEKRNVVEGTREFVEQKGYRYSDIEPDDYYSNEIRQLR